MTGLVLCASLSLHSTLTVDPLYIDCWPSLHCTLTWFSLHWLLNLSTLIVDPLHCTLTVDPLYIDCWPSLHCILTVDPLYTVYWLLILSTLTVDCLYINCWSPPPPQDQQCWLPLWCWSLIRPRPTVNWPPQDQQCWSAPGRLSIEPPLQISTFESLMYGNTQCEDHTYG